MRSLPKSLALSLSLLLGLVGVTWVGVGGCISGTVEDQSGAAIAQAPITLINTGTGVRQSAAPDGQGIYAFPIVPVGGYVLEVNLPGIKPYRRTGIVLDANSAILIDIVLQVGKRSDTVIVSDSAIHIDTSSSQMGEVIRGSAMTEVPLNGRSYTDLLSLQSGVAPATSITSSTVQDVGASAFSPSGDLNPGNISINGQLRLNHNPRNGQPYFDVNLFGLQPLGEPGNAKRRFVYGPGIDNYDIALQKNVSLTESKSIQFRFEGFNVFNHAQFYGPASVNGNINSSTFGQVVSAAAPRVMQAAVKLVF